MTVSRLSFGTGTNGWAGRSRQTDIGLKALSDLLVYGYSRGITFIDSADAYGSHPHVKEALKRIPRERVVIATKTFATKSNSVRAEMDRFRSELGTDILDIVLMHCVKDGWNIAMKPVMDVLSEAKKRGIARAIGVSPHSWGALEAAAEDPWVDVALVRLNYAGVNMDSRMPAKVIPLIEKMRAAGKGVYAMKAFGTGSLKDAPRALGFCLGVPVDAVTVGMETRAHVDENVRIVLEADGKTG